MIDRDDVTIWIAVSILRSGDREIEAMQLEALGEDLGPREAADAALDPAFSENSGGAFGMEIVGTLLIPVLVQAVRTFWASYEKQLIEKLGKNAADATIDMVKRWFSSAGEAEQKAAGEKLAEAIRTAGTARGLGQADIDALVAATALDQLKLA